MSMEDETPFFREIRKVHAGLCEEIPLSEFAARVRIAYRGIVLREGENPDVWWVHVYAPRKFPSARTVRALILLAYLGGARFLAAGPYQVEPGKTTRSVSEKLVAYFGFREIEPGLWTLQLD